MSGGRSNRPKGQNGGGRPPVDSKTRARIRKLAREGLSQSEVARRTEVSRSTVAKVCAEARPPITFDRSKTEAAVKAHTADLKAQRAQLASDVLGEVRTLIERLSAPHIKVLNYQGQGFDHWMAGPESGDVKNYAIAIGVLLDKHAMLVRFDADDRDMPAVDRWLAGLGVAGTVVAA